MESKRLESRKTLRSGADKLAGTMISNFKNTLELTQRRGIFKICKTHYTIKLYYFQLSGNGLEGRCVI